MELLQPLNDPTFTARTASYTGTAGSTGTWPAGPQGVVIWSTTAAYVVIGEGVTATTAGTPIPANTPIPFVVPANVSGPWRVSAIQIASGGAVYAKPINIR
jgi:uncharacterized cupin superfamily protein